MTYVISSHITKLVVVILITIFVVASQDITDNSDVGYRIGKVKGYKKLRQFAKSALYEVQCDELDDGRPIKLLDLHGSHFDAGYAYTKLMAKQINFSYKTFMHSALGNEAEIKLIQLFLDWQYQSFVQKQIPFQFLEELRGIDKGAREEHYPLLGRYFKRTLVISSFPGALQHDIASILADQFWKKVIGIKNEKHESFIQDEILKITQTLMKFIKKVGVHCSFFATWGKRTINQKLYSMRNLDWLENTGVNQNKLITVWNIDSTIPHLTLGYPGILGALTGMSRAGLTVHEAGLSNHHSTELGFQWTLRMRYIMMHASNLAQVKKIWDSTNNTLGMNFMVASSSDNIPFGYPALAMETMRGYTAYFHDNDPRENATQFYDPKTKKQYTAGYGMPNALFRTNHGYDPTIVKHLRNSQISENDDSMIRYKVMKNAFHYYEKNQQKMGPAEAVNITAILGDKGSEKFLTCQDNFKGINVISVTYDPQQLVMWAAFEYGFEKTFRSACCGVYVEMDMRKWLI